MSQYYKGKRTRNLYDPKSTKPYKISRSKIDLFLECKKCFYLDRRLGVGRPPGYPFALNSTVDLLLKKEFDEHRAKDKQHPLQKKYKISARPVAHDMLDVWRENFKGVQYHHGPTNLIITGAIDDLWQDGRGQYVVVDYKATSKQEPVKKLDKPWQDGYKRQMEVYQWLLRRNGLKVSNTGYFVYCNGRQDKKAFDAKLEFDVELIAYRGKDDWVEPTIKKIKRTLDGKTIPKSDSDCDYCRYRAAVKKVSK